MFSKFVLIPALLSATIFLGENTAQAQWRGGGSRGGGSGGWSGGRSGFSGGWYGGGGYGGGWGSPFRYGYCNYGYGNYGYGGNSYGYPRYYSSYPGYSSYSGYSYYPDYSSNYVEPGVFSSVPSAQVVDNSTARIRVILPDEQGRVWFDGNVTMQTGRDRLFTTPPLTTGGNNTYRIRASWVQGNQEMVQERTISVIPGQMAVVDFTQPSPESQPLPKPGQ